MHIAGILENDRTKEIIDTIKYILYAVNKKVSFSEYAARFKNKQLWNDYLSALIQIETEILVIKIKSRDADEALRTLPLNTLIVNDYTNWKAIYSKNKRDLSNLLCQMIVILNSDIIKPSNFTDEEKCRLLFYGFSSDSNITTSSTGEPFANGKFLCCVREGLISTNGNVVEPQEFVVNLENTVSDPYSILAAASFAVLNDIDTNRLNLMQ